MKNERYGRCKFIFSSPDSKLLFTQVPVVNFFFLLYVRVSFVRDWKMNSLLIYLPYHRNIFFVCETTSQNDAVSSTYFKNKTLTTIFY